MSQYKLKSNLSEKQMESDLSGFFAWVSRDTPFRLLDIDEQLTGADKKFYDSGFAFFMQFKVSQGLKPINKVASSIRKNRSPLEDVREFRERHGLYDDPTLYFELRRMATRASDFQHNVLLGYANKPNSQAFYVAPLHLDKDNYYNCLFDSVNRFYPHSCHPYEFRSYKQYRKNWVSYIGHVPFLKEHVSIIPHEGVTTHKHYYSFSPTGGDIGWHSPELLSEKPSRLSDLLNEEITKCLHEEKFINISELSEALKVEHSEPTENNQEPIRRIQEWGKRIYLKDGIRLYLLLGNKEFIQSIEA